MDSIILNNSIERLFIVFSVIILILLFKKLLSKYFAALVYNSIHKKWNAVEKNEFIALIVKPLGWFLSIVIAVIMFDNLVFPDALKFNVYGSSSKDILHKSGLCLIIIFFIWIIKSVINFIALVLENKNARKKDNRDEQIIVFFRDFFKVIINIIGVLLLLKTGLGINIGSLITGLSIVGAALALAAKESIENLIASFIIFFDKPFYTGDVVKVNQINGTIEHIGLRSTRIRTTDQTLVSVPNKQMVDSIVDNWSMRIGRRAEIIIELELKTPSDKIELLIHKIKALLKQKQSCITQYSVYIIGYNKSGVSITTEYFTSGISVDFFNELKQELMLQMKNLIEEDSIQLAKEEKN